MLEKLPLAPELRTTESYGALFLRWKEETASAAENLTFDEIAACAEIRNAGNRGALIQAA